MTFIAQASPPPGAGALLAIGELAARTGVPASALRYYDELGLVRPRTRTAGRRQYDGTAIRAVGLIVTFREIGFSLAEIKVFLAGEAVSRRQLVERKLSELADQQHRIDVARSALEHGLHCPAGDQTACPRFWSIIDRHQQGLSFEESHSIAHH